MPSRDLRNSALNVIGEACWGLGSGLIATATVFTVVLREFGASERTLGAVIAIETGAT
jgi:hypothetical protein